MYFDRFIIQFKWFLVIALTGSAGSLTAKSAEYIEGATVLSGNAIEGGLIVARTLPANKVMLNEILIPVTVDGLFIIGFDRDSDTPLDVQVLRPHQAVMHTTLIPQQRIYDIQRIDGLKNNMVTPPKEVLNRITADQAAVFSARQQTAAVGDFWKGFDWPVIGPISGVFGSQRVLNGQPRQPHYGVDIVAPRGTLVQAPASGTVTLVKNLYFSGWTVILNHGLGLNSTFLHMESVAVHNGAEVLRGATVGAVGSSGRSTGAHLDWRLDWNGHRIDASLATGAMTVGE